MLIIKRTVCMVSVACSVTMKCMMILEQIIGCHFALTSFCAFGAMCGNGVVHGIVALSVALIFVSLCVYLISRCVFAVGHACVFYGGELFFKLTSWFWLRGSQIFW